MNTSAAVGDVIPITGAAPASVSATVVNTSVGAGVLTGVGVVATLETVIVTGETECKNP